VKWVCFFHYIYLIICKWGLECYYISLEYKDISVHIIYLWISATIISINIRIIDRISVIGIAGEMSIWLEKFLNK